MSKLIAIKIDVTKYDEARLYQGAKGKYLDATVFLSDEQGQYGDNGMITQSVSKEEREAGVKGNILGNVKILGEFGDNKPAAAPAPAAVESDDIPF